MDKPTDATPNEGTEPNQGNPPAATATVTAAATPAAASTPAIPEGYVPADSLRAVTAERDRLAREAKNREEEAAKQRGEWEGIAKTREQERDSAIDRAKTTAIRSAFVSQIAPNVVDATAAYVLARDAGMLKDVGVNDEFEADDKAIAKAVEDSLKKFTYLKAGQRSFGDPRDGSEQNPPIDPSKADARSLLRSGYDSSGSTRRQG